MKVKSILKVASCVKYEIIETRDDETMVEHCVDYTKGIDEIKDYGCFIDYPCLPLLPKRIVDANVKMVTTNSATNALMIYVC